jgi:hypothetical protein
MATTPNNDGGDQCRDGSKRSNSFLLNFLDAAEEPRKSDFERVGVDDRDCNSQGKNSKSCGVAAAQ